MQVFKVLYGQMHFTYLSAQDCGRWSLIWGPSPGG